jgi:radical SAM protein with 4Fe4S-binding SPASM domain
VQADIHPALLLLWLNNRCNARCPMCEIWRERGSTFIDAREIESMVGHWVTLGVKEVELCGEPTLHPQLEEVCSIIRAAGIDIRFLSNGLLLKKHAHIIAEYGKSLTVSLDGPPSVHNTIRNVPTAYRRLAEGIAELRALSPSIAIHGRCVVHRHNYRQLMGTVDTARDLTLTDISFLGLDITSQAFGRDKLDDRPLAVADLMIGAGEIPALRDAVEIFIAAERASLGNFVRESAAVLRSALIEHVEAHWFAKRGEQRTIKCNVPWTSAVIEFDGSVRPCWFLPAYGNLREHSNLHALLTSPAASQYRSELDVATNPTCRACVCPRMIDGG